MQQPDFHIQVKLIITANLPLFPLFCREAPNARVKYVAIGPLVNEIKSILIIYFLTFKPVDVTNFAVFAKVSTIGPILMNHF